MIPWLIVKSRQHSFALRTACCCTDSLFLGDYIHMETWPPGRPISSNLLLIIIIDAALLHGGFHTVIVWLFLATARSSTRINVVIKYFMWKALIGGKGNLTSMSEFWSAKHCVYVSHASQRENFHISVTLFCNFFHVGCTQFRFNIQTGECAEQLLHTPYFSCQLGAGNVMYQTDDLFSNGHTSSGNPQVHYWAILVHILKYSRAMNIIVHLYN